jgi:hypothetical protein
MNWSPWILPLFLGVSLSSIYFLPRAGETAQSAVKMELPGAKGGWEFRKIPPSKDEQATLEKDTEFAKAICLKPRPGEISLDGYLIPDRVDLSVVLSGHDLNSSIHRPERCMPAQGHNITASGPVTLKLPNGRQFETKRLRSVQTIGGKDGSPVQQFNCITYYFFIGRNRITNDHLERTLVDMKDRLVHGMDQRWAYVSASMWFGNIPWLEEKEISEQEADEKLRAFITQFAEDQISWELVK